MTHSKSVIISGTADLDLITDNEEHADLLVNNEKESLIKTLIAIKLKIQSLESQIPDIGPLSKAYENAFKLLKDTSENTDTHQLRQHLQSMSLEIDVLKQNTTNQVKELKGKMRAIGNKKRLAQAYFSQRINP